MFKKTFTQINNAVDKGSKDIQSLVKKAEGFVSQAEAVIKSSDDSIKVIAGFMIASMGMQMLVSYTQLRVNIKMLNLMRGIKK